MLRRNDGTEMICLITATAWRDGSGRVEAHQNIIRDVTAHKAREQKLTAVKERLQLALTASSTAVWSWDLITGDVAWSPECYALFGRTEETFDGTYDSYLDLILSEDRPAVQAQIRRALERGEPYDVEHRITTSTPGTVRWLYGRGQVYFNDQGQPARMAGTLVDITERKRAEAALRTSRERFRSLFQEAGIGIAIVSTDGAILESNPALQHMLGYPAETLAGMTIEQVTHPEDYANDMALCRKMMAGAMPSYHLEKRYLCADGTLLWGRLTAFLGRDGADAPAFVIRMIEDITAHKQQEQALVAAKEKAEEMNRLKSAFLANMSHEIRTPLTAIIGFADLLADEVPPEVQNLVAPIYRSGKRLMFTLNSVLDLAQLESGTLRLSFETLDLVAQAHEVLHLFRPQLLDRSLELTIEAPDTPVWVFLDKGAVGRVLTNLIANAVKFTKKGHVHVAIRPDDAYVDMAVEDTGIGISPDFLPHIFDEFKQESSGVRRSHEGSGLGLTITRQLVEMMGGSIRAESEKGTGSVFTVRFPFERNPG